MAFPAYENLDTRHASVQEKKLKTSIRDTTTWLILAIALSPTLYFWILFPNFRAYPMAMRPASAGFVAFGQDFIYENEKAPLERAFERHYRTLTAAAEGSADPASEPESEADLPYE